MKTPLNVLELKQFKEERFSAIRDMLDYAKCDKTTMLMSSLGKGTAGEDEKVMEMLEVMRKKKAQEMAKEA